ncbi:enterochelin esterase domain-containing protein [Vibrio metschnikovii]
MWWQQMAFEGMPIVMNAEDEYADVIFIWREPKGSDIREVYIDINGVTDHHRFYYGQAFSDRRYGRVVLYRCC